MLQNIKIARLIPRMGGALIDFLIVLIMTSIIVFVWAVVIGLNGSETSYSKEYSNSLWEGRGILVWLIADLIYTVAMQSSESRATLGQKAVGICIVKTNLQNASIGNLVLRHFISIFSSLLLKIGFFIALFTKNKQTLHDLVAGTIVIELDVTDSATYAVQNNLKIDSTHENQSDSSGAIIPIVSAVMIVGTLIALIRHYS